MGLGFGFGLRLGFGLVGDDAHLLLCQPLGLTGAHQVDDEP